jgi:hypothetical protein
MVVIRTVYFALKFPFAIAETAVDMMNESILKSYPVPWLEVSIFQFGSTW